MIESDQSCYLLSEVAAMTSIGTAQTPAVAQLEVGDGELLRRFFYRLSPETIYRRFMSPLARPEQARPEVLLDVDHRDREAILAMVGGEIVGVARYSRRAHSDTADLAIVVADAWQRQGLATCLLSALSASARRAGISRFEVMTQADNRAALGLLRRLWPETRLACAQAVCEGSVSIGGSEDDAASTR
jgi:RimJ/RimL family protein N-acetyltransferase